jgi:hypothetical protein
MEQSTFDKNRDNGKPSGPVAKPDENPSKNEASFVGRISWLPSRPSADGWSIWHLVALLLLFCLACVSLVALVLATKVLLA